MLFVIHCSDARDFCMHESFTARCEPGSVVLMLSAVYGRMRLGRCIRGDYNVGCSTDVVSFFDAHCTGRQSCRVGVRNLIDIHPCQRDFTSYLEASYRCIRGRLPVASIRTRHQGGAHGGRAPAQIVRAPAKITGLFMLKNRKRPNGNPV